MKHGNALGAVFADAAANDIRDFFAQVRGTSPLWAWIEYHLGLDAGATALGRSGKRVRPVVLLSTVNSLGGDVAAALPVAAAVELLHSAALVFDDIQDQADIRRGRPAIWRVCGSAQALNVGVALQAAVHLAVARALRSGMPAERALAASEELGLCTLRLVEGQYRDLTFQEGLRPTIDDYMRMCADKTASLLASAAYLGAVLAGRADLGPVTRRLGYHLGMYLQIEDDVAGIWGNSDIMGKLPSDLQGRKKTLPILYVFQMEELPPGAAELAERFFGRQPLLPGDAEALKELAVVGGGRAYAEEMAGLHRELALRALDELGSDVGRDLGAIMEDLAATLVAPA